MRSSFYSWCLGASAAWILSVGTVRAQSPVPIERLYDAHMFPGEEVYSFSHAESYFPSKVVKRGGPVGPLPASPLKLQELQFKTRGQNYDLYDYLTWNRVAGLLILKDGRVVFEHYELGAEPDTRWTSWSMAKSFGSTLIGVALKEGLIRSLDEPVVRYVPALKGGAYDNVSIRDILMMASGVKWNETYTDPKSDRRKLLGLNETWRPGVTVEFMRTRSVAAPPGTVWNYNTGESFLAGAVVEGATHRPLATYLSEKIWSRLGMESDATWWTEAPGGMGLSGWGLCATLRDYGRFGLFVLSGGMIDGQRIVPDGWFEEAGRAHRYGGRSVDYGYLWWPVPAGDPIQAGAFEAQGAFGQHIYVNPKENVVIVALSAHSKQRSMYDPLEDLNFFGSVCRQLHRQN